MLSMYPLFLSLFLAFASSHSLRADIPTEVPDAVKQKYSALIAEKVETGPDGSLRLHGAKLFQKEASIFFTSKVTLLRWPTNMESCCKIKWLKALCPLPLPWLTIK